MNKNKDVLKYAKNMGYEDAVYKMNWKGYEVYEPIYSEELSYIGLPLMILEKGGKIRMTNAEEAFEILDITADIDEKIETSGKPDYEKALIVGDDGGLMNKMRGFFGL